MNSVVVLNLRNFLPTRARESMQAACERWGCYYNELTAPLNRCHHFWQKTFIFQSIHVQHHERVLVLDGDMLIRSDCPNPFALVPEEMVGVVSRVQPHRRYRLRFPGPAVIEERAAMFGLQPYAVEEQHLNGGFVLYSPRIHQELLLEWQAAGRRIGFRKFWWNDQAALSCVLATHHAPVYWLGHWWNTLDAGRHKDYRKGPMETFIYHFNAPRRRPLAQMMEEVEWKVQSS